MQLKCFNNQKICKPKPRCHVIMTSSLVNTTLSNSKRKNSKQYFEGLKTDFFSKKYLLSGGVVGAGVVGADVIKNMKRKKS